MSNEQKPVIPRATFIAVGATFVAMLSMFVQDSWIRFALLGVALILVFVAGANLRATLKKKSGDK